MQDLIKLSAQLLSKQNFDYLAVGVINFDSQKINTFELNRENQQSEIEVTPPYIFDLASLTKPLFLNLLYLQFPDKFSKEMLLLLEHRGGLPAWGRLTANNWRDKINSFSIVESDTEYSDFSALRLMLELEKTIGKDLISYCKKYWHEGVRYWQEVENFWQCPPTGTRKGGEIRGQVHDDNAYNIGSICSHAGLFSDIESLCKTLIQIDKGLGLITNMQANLKGDQRFIKGWDRAINLESTLAGQGCSGKTFGHLGFTGTSIWIDTEKKIGHVILSNATQNYWYDREELNKLRKSIGSFIWQNKWN